MLIIQLIDHPENKANLAGIIEQINSQRIFIFVHSIVEVR